jgi:hypothetical protein
MNYLKSHKLFCITLLGALIIGILLEHFVLNPIGATLFAGTPPIHIAFYMGKGVLIFSVIISDSSRASRRRDNKKDAIFEIVVLATNLTDFDDSFFTR